jgi:hypothetical protein
MDEVYWLLGASEALLDSSCDSLGLLARAVLTAGNTASF